MNRRPEAMRIGFKGPLKTVMILKRAAFAAYPPMSSIEVKS